MPEHEPAEQDQRIESMEDKLPASAGTKGALMNAWESITNTHNFRSSGFHSIGHDTADGRHVQFSEVEAERLITMTKGEPIVPPFNEAFVVNTAGEASKPSPLIRPHDNNTEIYTFRPTEDPADPWDASMRTRSEDGEEGEGVDLTEAQAKGVLGSLAELKEGVWFEVKPPADRV